MTKNIKNNFVSYLIILFVLGIFWDPINKFFALSLINPFLSKIDNHSLFVQILLIGAVVCYHFAFCKQIVKEDILSIRRLNICFMALILLLFRFFGDFIYYGIVDSGLAYIDIVMITELTAEILMIIVSQIKKALANHNRYEFSSLPFTIDQPTKNDGFDRNTYADILINKLISTYNYNNDDTSFTVLLSEGFGQGKTSFFELIKESCKTKNIEVIEFKPWLSNNANKMIINFFDLLKEHYGYNKKLIRILKTYSVLASDNMVGKTASVIINNNNQDSIESQHHEIINILKNDKKTKIVLIDDVDRLQVEELLALIKLIRNSADFPYISYIIAADKASLKETLSNVGIKNPNEYLKKFFNFELLFPADDNNLLSLLINYIVSILQKFNYTSKDYNELIIDIDKHRNILLPVFKNPRDIVRFINIVSFDLDIMYVTNHKQNSDLPFDDINVADFVKLCMIQYISPELYKILRDYHYVLLETSNGKYCIKNDFENYINDRVDYRQMLKTLDNAAKINNPESTRSKIDPEVISFKNANDLINRNQPDEEEALKYLLDDMWSHGYVYDLRRICYPCQYFLYFAGKYRINEISNETAISLYTSSNDEFKNTIDKNFDDKKDSLIHKLNIVVIENKVSIQTLLPNIISLLDVDYKSYMKRNPYGLGYKDYYFTQTYQYIIMNLYSIKKADKTYDISKIYEDHKAFFNTSKDYAWCSLYIHSISKVLIDDYNEYTPLFSVKQTDMFARIVTNKFFDNAFKKHPFDINVIKTIPCIKTIDWKYWNDKFFDYVKNSKNPSEWLFRLFKLSTDKTYIY